MNMTSLFYDATEIKKAISILKPDNELFEIRIIRGRSSISGYFRDADSVIACLGQQNLKGANVYMTVQRVHEGCEARVQWNQFIDSGREKIPTTSDFDITAYKYIPIDLDPVRPAGISSTAEELKAAEDLRGQVVEYMAEQDFKKCITAFSGNGYHLLFPVDLPNTDENKEYVRSILLRLDELFSNPRCHVDTTAFNPARIFKLYGTLAQKGRSTESRPHRMSKLLGVVGYDTN